MGKIIYPVSYWHLPGGYAVERAEVRIKEFESWEKADEFVRKYMGPPEMAAMMEPFVKN